MVSDVKRASFFTRFAIGFSSSFGTARAFGITTALVLVWLAIMPWVGITQWNSSWGLAGNTSESTVELFLAIAVQYTTNRVEIHQHIQMEALENAMTRIEQLENAIDDKMTSEFDQLLEAINLLNTAAVVSPPPRSAKRATKKPVREELTEDT